MMNIFKRAALGQKIASEDHDLRMSELKQLHDLIREGKEFEALTTAFYIGVEAGYTAYSEEEEA